MIEDKDILYATGFYLSRSEEDKYVSSFTINGYYLVLFYRKEIWWLYYMNVSKYEDYIVGDFIGHFPNAETVVYHVSKLSMEETITKEHTLLRERIEREERIKRISEAKIKLLFDFMLSTFIPTIEMVFPDKIKFTLDNNTVIIKIKDCPNTIQVQLDHKGEDDNVYQVKLQDTTCRTTGLIGLFNFLIIKLYEMCD